MKSSKAFLSYLVLAASWSAGFVRQTEKLDRSVVVTNFYSSSAMRRYSMGNIPASF